MAAARGSTVRQVCALQITQQRACSSSPTMQLGMFGRPTGSQTGTNKERANSKQSMAHAPAAARPRCGRAATDRAPAAEHGGRSSPANTDKQEGQRTAGISQRQRQQQQALAGAALHAVGCNSEVHRPPHGPAGCRPAATVPCICCPPPRWLPSSPADRRMQRPPRLHPQ